jgi:hypothetical protein
MGMEKTFKLTGEPLYGAQDKSRGLLSNNQCNIVDILCDQVGDQCTMWGEHSETTLDEKQAPCFDRLKQPHLNTSKNMVLGHNKMQMQKENKQRQKILKANQPIILLWTTH